MRKACQDREVDYQGEEKGHFPQSERENGSECDTCNGDRCHRGRVSPWEPEAVEMSMLAESASIGQ
ncbi:hypothetical protein NYP80_11625 [Erwinia pyrifoliae]|uniref:hypothetical protein n=1 Tax=Erwinia pyrifoliae TaxID=79967 RepID=UPI0021BE2EC9|nr:hypothetical protein [Erwinia pyrifoliae]UXK10989.1 hypothetical protein NYP80_11625 [Erwinia pyrifoliae]